MSFDWIITSCFLLGLSSALVAGVFKAFSEIIMKALARTQPAGAIEAMQHINVTVMRTEFIVSFIALAPLSALFALYGWTALSGLERNLIIAAGLVYVLSVFLVTILGNVPMNNNLAKLSFDSPGARNYWGKYLKQWTWLNHIRTIGSIVTAGLYFLAMLSLAQ